MERIVCDPTYATVKLMQEFAAEAGLTLLIPFAGIGHFKFRQE
jgi:hypothetical protein